MKKLELIIRPTRLEELKQAAERLGLRGMTVTQVMGCGMQKGHTEVYRGTAYSVNLLPKLKVEMVVSEAAVETALTALAEAVRTGEVGDGKIFVLPVDEALRIRTGERGDEAL